MDKTLCALSIVTDHQAIDILRKARQDLAASQSELVKAKKALFWLRFQQSLPQVVRDFAKYIHVCECLSCKQLLTGQTIGHFVETDLAILGARERCALKKYLEGLARDCPGIFRQEPNVSFFLTLDEDLSKQDPQQSFESLDVFLKFVGKVYGNDILDDADLKQMKDALSSLD